MPRNGTANPTSSSCLSARSDTAAILVPPQADLLRAVSEALLAQHAPALPDLGHVVCLLPDSAAFPALRRRLTQCAGGALLGPRLLTLSQFAAERGVLVPRSAAECRLILLGALRRYRNLFPGQDLAQVAEALFDLFEELNLQAASLAEDEAALGARLQKAYGAAGPLSAGGPSSGWESDQEAKSPPAARVSSTLLAAISREAQIVHRLWRAFAADTAGRSPAAAYCANLRTAFAGLGADETLYLIGFDTFSGGERAALAAAPQTARIALWLHGRLEGHDGAALRELCARLELTPKVLPVEPDARTQFLDAAYADEDTAAPAAPGDLRISAAPDAESEARCVDLAVREWWLSGCADIAVVTEDRRLARRLRALLERAGLPLQDEVGWALSTSSAAAALDAWCRTLEGGFQFRALLALLKSGFLETGEQSLRELERDLIYGAQIESGLQNFRERAGGRPALRELLDRLARATQAMPALERARPGHHWVAALERSLDALGLSAAFQKDRAGARLLETLRELGAAAARQPLVLEWREFRALLDRALERATFVPESRGRVRLLTLAQARGLSCEALVLAGASRAHLPGAPPGEPFFNQSVRTELGLPGFVQRRDLALARLRRVLPAATRVRITYAAERRGEPPQPSPWIEALEDAAEARATRLRDAQLGERAARAAVEIAAPGTPPARPRARPAPVAPPELFQRELSASAHQRLIDCPYQFFATAGLRLAPEIPPDRDPDRRDYGNHVHRILRASAEPVAGLPPPFPEPVTPANRAQAQARLEEIAEAVFAPELARRTLAQLWRSEFHAALPPLLDWLIQRGAVRVEAEYQYPPRELAGWWLKGTADRVETRADGTRAIVDYKTGALARSVEVEAGEAVQLLHYALLDEQATAVEYLALRKDRKAVRIEQRLAELRTAVERRLAHILAALDRGAPLPAHGAATICERCDYRGLCRKGEWTNDGTESAS